MTSDVRFDTRGLPEFYDPHRFYEYRISNLASSATGVEAFLYRILPYGLIRSFAIAIDPFTKFRTADVRITPANRKRTRKRFPFPARLTIGIDRTNWLDASLSNYPVNGSVGPIEFGTRVTGHTTQYGPYFDWLPEFSSDTTRRTRLFGSDFGEFEKFSHTLITPERSNVQVSQDLAWYDTSSYPPPSLPNRVHNGYEVTNASSQGPAAKLSQSVYQQLQKDEATYANALLQKHALSLYKSVNPVSRNYTLFRNIVELRDVPGSILTLRESLSTLSQLYRRLSSPQNLGLRDRIFDLSTLSKQVSNEYLSYQFGWRQLWSDIQGILSQPEKISKQINFLLSRSGKDTTYRSKRVIPSAESRASGFEYTAFGIDAGPNTTKHRLERSTEIRCVFNCAFRFPDVGVPEFQSKLFRRKLGVDVNPVDLYNLVPWTWLYDWFTGLGNYLDIIETINSDSSIVNYGFLTVDTRGSLISQYDYSGKIVTTHSDGRPAEPIVYVRNAHTTQLDYRYVKRIDMSQSLNVASASTGRNLSPYQSSILTALLLQRNRYSPSNIKLGGQTI